MFIFTVTVDDKKSWSNHHTSCLYHTLSVSMTRKVGVITILHVYIICYQSRDVIYPVLKGSGFVRRQAEPPFKITLPFKTGYITSRD